MSLRSIQIDLENLEKVQNIKIEALRLLRERKAVETDVLEKQKLELQIKNTQKELIDIEEEIFELEHSIQKLKEKLQERQLQYSQQQVVELPPDEWFEEKKSGFGRFFRSIFEDK